MFKLKVDPELNHHYIIGVAMYGMNSSTPGKMFLKYGPVYFQNKDVENVGDCLVLSKDKIYKNIYQVKNTQLYEMYNCSELIMALTGLRLAAEANNASLHHFSSPEELYNPEKFFEGYVKRANDPNSSERKGLDDAKIH
jgi:hypothetical protein